MAIFTLLITRTALGRAQRACEQDRTMTALMGINVDRTISMTFIIGSSLSFSCWNDVCYVLRCYRFLYWFLSWD